MFNLQPLRHISTLPDTATNERTSHEVRVVPLFV